MKFLTIYRHHFYQFCCFPCFKISFNPFFVFLFFSSFFLFIFHFLFSFLYSTLRGNPSSVRARDCIKVYSETQLTITVSYREKVASQTPQIKGLKYNFCFQNSSMAVMSTHTMSMRTNSFHLLIDTQLVLDDNHRNKEAIG